MADLVDRIAGVALDRPKINLHRFMGLERLYAMGVWTRTLIGTEFDLQGLEATQAAQIADNIDAQQQIGNKIIYIARVESVMMCLEDGEDTFYHNVDGTLDKTIIYRDLQITG